MPRRLRAGSATWASRRSLARSSPREARDTNSSSSRNARPPEEASNLRPALPVVSYTSRTTTNGVLVSYPELAHAGPMAAVAELRPLEHVTPHDLVTYSRCPHEMELLHARHLSIVTGQPVAARTPVDVVPLRHSPLFTPPNLGLVVSDGRLDIAPGDRLVYEDEGEEGLPIMFADEQTRLDARYRAPNGTLIDTSLNLTGRPDFVIQQTNGEFIPVEYKSTHLFVGYHESHGRTFDVIQAIAECRLVHSAFGRRPSHGVILYGDVAGDGEHEGWVQVPYGEAEERWLRAALVQIRTDGVRAPVPAERNCATCAPNKDGLCRYAAARYGEGHQPLGGWDARRI
jgi:hypothetical protein